MAQRPQKLWILAVALILWTLWDEPTFGAVIAAYLVAWALFNWGGWVRLEAKAPRPVALGATALLLAAPAIHLLVQLPQLAAAEGIYGLAEQVADRLRVERLPALAPPLVVADRPQTFHVYAPGGRRVRLSFGGGGVGGRAMEAVALGHGLFRAEYDPRRDGAPVGPAWIEVDGVAHEREVAVVRGYARPRWLVADAARGIAAAVSEETDALVLVERSGALRQVEVGDGPSDVALFDEGRRAAVAHRHEAPLYIVDTASGEVLARVALGPSAARVAVSADGRRLAASLQGTRRGVAVLELPEGREIGFAALPCTPDWLAFVDEETLVVAGLEPRALFEVGRRGGEWEVLRGPLHLGRPVVTATRRAAGGRLYVATTGYRGDGGMPEGNHFVEDQILTVDLARFAVVDQLLTARGGSRQDEPGNVESGASPMGLDVGADGSLWVAFAGTDEVWRLPPGSRMPEVLLDVRRAGLPLRAPHGVVDLGEGQWAVSSPLDGAIAVIGAGGEVVALHRLAPPDEALLASDPAGLARRRGERGFYEATRSGVSCQSCHPHGGHDFSAHDITPRGRERVTLEGTLSVAGIAGTAPYLRAGGYPHIGDLDRVSRERYGGHARAEEGRAGLLEAYVEALPLPLNPRALGGRDVERERRGLSAFVKARCDLCHAFPAFTHLGKHPARWLFPRFGARLPAGEQLDTPSLLGLWASAPYLMDGRAATVEAVLREDDPGHRHGDVEALSESELGDLVYLLEGL